MKLQNLSAKPSPRNFKAESLVFLEFFPINKLHIPLNARLNLSSSCTRSTHKPVPLKTQHAFNPSVSILGNFRFNFLFFQISRIISLVKLYLMTVNLKHIVADSIKKIAVMSNHQQSSVCIVQIILKPCNRRNIKMIGGFIQKKKLCILNKNLSQRNLFYHSAA